MEARRRIWWPADPVCTGYPLRRLAPLRRRFRPPWQDHDRYGPDSGGLQGGMRLVARAALRSGRQHPGGQYFQLERLRRQSRNRYRRGFCYLAGNELAGPCRGRDRPLHRDMVRRRDPERCAW